LELLERETECATLDRLIEGGGLVVFEGPPGAGTSALLCVLDARADAAGRLALCARATPPVRDVPFGLARRLLEPWVSRLAMAGWARHARPLFEGDVRAGGMLIEGLVALIDELATARGLVVLAVDDAHGVRGARSTTH
jgi:hypothetical protein